MKNNKISSEKYSEILSSIELSNIFLQDCTIKKFDVKPKAGSIDLSIKTKFEFGQDSNKLYISAKYKLEGILVSGEIKEKLISIAPCFTVTYIKNKEIEIEDDFIEVFKKTSIELVTWPYFREFIQSTTSRMGLPPLTLPPKFFSNNK